MKSVHWTQRPENAARVAALAKKRWLAKRDEQIQNNSSILEQYAALRRQTRARIDEINKQMDVLKMELEQLTRIVDMGENNETSGH